MKKTLMTAKRTLAAALAATLLSEPASAVSLEDAILYVIETNPEIKAAEASKQAIEFELDQAQSFRAPRFELEGRTGASRNDGNRIPDLTASDDTLYGYEVSARVSQLLFDGWETRSEIERQAYRVDAAALRVLERSEFLALEAVRVYADVLRAARLVQLAQDNVAYHREVFCRIEQAFENGVVGIGDLQQAEERVFLAEDTLTQFLLTQNDADAQFLEIVGIEPDGLGSVPDVGARVPASLEDALAIARTRNPTIRFLQADVGTAEALSRRIDANRYPTLHLEAEARYGEDVRGFEGDVRDAEIGLVLRYDFQGAQKRANRQEHIRRVSEARALLLTQARLVEREVRQSWADRETVARRLGLLTRQANLSRELRASYESEFEVGTRSLLDILNTQNALFQAEANLVNARSLETFVDYRLLAAVGVLLPTLGVAPPEDAAIYAAGRTGAPAVRAAEDSGRLDASSFGDWRRSLGE